MILQTDRLSALAFANDLVQLEPGEHVECDSLAVAVHALGAADAYHAQLGATRRAQHAALLTIERQNAPRELVAAAVRGRAHEQA